MYYKYLPTKIAAARILRRPSLNEIHEFLSTSRLPSFIKLRKQNVSVHVAGLLMSFISAASKLKHYFPSGEISFIILDFLYQLILNGNGKIMLPYSSYFSHFQKLKFQLKKMKERGWIEIRYYTPFSASPADSKQYEILKEDYLFAYKIFKTLVRSYHLESLQARLKDIEELLERYYENGEYLGSSSFEIVKGKIEKGFLPTYLELENLEKELGFPVVERAIRIRKGNELFDKLYSVAEISELTKEMFPSNEITLEVLHPEQFIRSLFLIGLEVCLYFISSYDRKVTIGEISDKLGVNPRTVLNVTSILRDYGLIERKRGEYYPARSLYSFGLEIISLMKRRVEWLKKYIGAQEMYKKGENIGKISRELNIHQYTVYNWVKMGDKPRRVSLTTLYNLKRFGQIEDEDIEKLKNHGLVR